MAAKLARRQHGEEKCSPHERGRNLEHRAVHPIADGARWAFLLKFRLSAPLRQAVIKAQVLCEICPKTTKKSTLNRIILGMYLGDNLKNWPTALFFIINSTFCSLPIQFSIYYALKM